MLNNWPELLIGGPSTVVTEDNEPDSFLPGNTLFDDRERGLVVAVVEHELVGGGGTAPQLADSTAAKDVLGGQPDEDLFDDNPLGQVVENCPVASFRHGD